MAKGSALETLAPELQLRILRDASTPDDLHALIQASPRLYQVYLLNKDIVLAAVARGQFHPAVMPDALIFAKIAQLKQPLSRDIAVKVCESYPEVLEELQETNTTIPRSVALCKLASNVGFFIEDYVRNTLPIMKGLGRSLDLDILPEYRPVYPVSYFKLSDSETGRLQRAFCRFEIYRYLFARCSSELDHDLRECSIDPSLPPAEQASLFLHQFPDFQIAEIICIRDYLYRRLRGICSRLEDEAVATLPPETFIFGQEGDAEADEWTSGAYLFTNNGKAYQNDHLEHLMSLGLSYIRRIFESNGEEQKKLFIRHMPRDVIQHLETQFITRALEFLGRNPAHGDIPLLAKTDPPFVYEINADAELDIPDAWQWAHPRAPPFYLKDSAMKGLRDWGFVFWDFDRLHESGILELRYVSFYTAG